MQHIPHLRQPIYLVAAWLLITAAGCEDPSPIYFTPIIYLEIQPETLEIWEGDTVTFTATASEQLPAGTLYRWTITPDCIVEGPEASISHVFPVSGSYNVSVTVAESPLSRVTFNPASAVISVRPITNELNIVTESKLWDAGIDLTMTATWGNKLPDDFSVRWDFGDGVREEVVRNMSCAHRYAKSGSYHISAELFDRARGVPLGSARAAVEIAPPTLGRFLHIEFRRGAFLYSIYRNDVRSESVVDSLVWHCDSILRWEGNRFHFTYTRWSSGVYGHRSNRELHVEGTLAAGRLENLTFLSTGYSSGFLQRTDSSMQFLRLAGVPEGPSGPGEYVLTGYDQVFPAVSTIQEYKSRSASYYKTEPSYRQILVNLNFPPDIELRITLSHKRSIP